MSALALPDEEGGVDQRSTSTILNRTRAYPVVTQLSKSINELFAEFAKDETPETRARDAERHAEYNALACRYDSTHECYVHGYLPLRPCGHSCYGAFFEERCPRCNRLPATGRQRTRKRWRRQGRR